MALHGFLHGLHDAADPARAVPAYADSWLTKRDAGEADRFGEVPDGMAGPRGGRPEGSRTAGGAGALEKLSQATPGPVPFSVRALPPGSPVRDAGSPGSAYMFAL